jgi:4-amino-4-deoxy-L-arabinose transferase-like glycosyltransferase
VSGLRATLGGAVSRSPARGIALCTALLLAALALGYRIGSPVLFEDPNEGQYAEVAREMVTSGEWISPQLNGVLFLNKPPLLYWSIGLAYRAFGIHEAAARLPVVLATLIILVVLYRLGAELFSPRVGLYAAAAYLAMPATVLEARLVRPDMLLTATTAAALLCCARVLRTEGQAQRRALTALQVVLAAGLLTKGIIALLLPAMPMAAVVLVERRADLVRLFCTPRSWMILLALAAPWHLVCAWRHEGFTWDYLVHQHLLFFFDRKLPRDSVPVPLTVFWGTFAGRVFPWTLLVPLAVAAALPALRGGLTERRAAVLLLAWAAGPLLFFSAAVSRMEHYSLPTMPAFALLLAAWWDASTRARTRADVARRALLGFTLLGLLIVAWRLPDALAEVAWLRAVERLPSLGRAFVALFIVGVAAALASRTRAPGFAVGALLAANIAAVPVLHAALCAIAPFNSSAPVAEVLSAAAGTTTRVVFEAPVEYQHCAGLDFYLRRSVTLLRPVGFVEPSYLLPYRDALFIDRAALESLWRTEPVLLVTDPLAPADRPLASIVPSPFVVVSEVGHRWVVRNDVSVTPAAPR